MNIYQKMIADATNIDDQEKIKIIENYIRVICFKDGKLGNKSGASIKKAAILSVADLTNLNWKFC